MKRMKWVLAMLLIAFLLTGVALAENIPKSTIDLTGFMNTVIAVLGALVTYRLLPWIRARTTQNQQEGLTACARTLVYAAEQLYRTGVVQNRLKYVEDGLRKQGYTVDRDAIEAAVTQLKIDTYAFVRDFDVEEGAYNEHGVCPTTQIQTAQVSATVDTKAEKPCASPRDTPDGDAPNCRKENGKIPEKGAEEGK